MDVSHILDNLNDDQRNAVTSEKQHLLVLAGAGSGKTRVLVHKIAWEVEALGVNPSSIMAVTFTNKAANEMRSRIESLLQAPMIDSWVGTFHGLSHKLLKRFHKEAGLSSGFTIIDSDDQLRIVKRISKEFSLDEATWPARQSQWQINSWKDDGLRSNGVDDKGDFYTETVKKVYKEYEEICQRDHLVDFGELLLKSYECLLNSKSVKTFFQTRFKSVLIDEFQDTNTIQYQLIKIMAGKNTSIFAVGDDDQSIYGWRGAKVENIKKLQKDFKDIEVYRLEQNYRSSGNILEAANKIILNNDSRMGKNLWTEDKSGEPVKIFSASDGYEEGDFVIETIQNLLSEDFSRNEIAILYRSNAQSRIFEDRLIKYGIKYRIYGGVRFYERAEIKDVIAYMRLAVLNNDDNSFERIVNNPPRGIGEKTKETLRQFSKEKGISLFDSIKNITDESMVAKKASQSLKEFQNIIKNIESILKKDELPHQINEIISITGIKSVYEKNKSEQAMSKLENLDQLVTAASDFTNNDLEEGETIIDGFLRHASLESGEGQGNEWEECVQLMTLHSSKGLEFPIVFLVGLEENLFPSRMSIEEDNLEEERRLCYVGITRARKKLFISHAQMRQQYGNENYCLPSRFLNEIPQNVVEEIGHKAKMFFKKSNGLNGDQNYKEDSIMGKRVIHKKFGEGIVISVEGSDSNTRVEVKFDDVGKKWLILAISNLEQI